LLVGDGHLDPGASILALVVGGVVGTGDDLVERGLGRFGAAGGAAEEQSERERGERGAHHEDLTISWSYR